MEKTLLKMLLVVGVSGVVGKYAYHRSSKTWSQAQDYCRQHHTDLAPVSVETDQQELIRASDPNAYGWIGIYRDPSNMTGWKWSGGTYLTYQTWFGGSPTSSFYKHCAYTYKMKWYMRNCHSTCPFFCFNVIVVTEEKTWEEALEHCREHHRDLVSLLSENELLLTLKEIRETTQLTTERLWTGLRYLGDRWLWVNRDSLKYQAWRQQGGEHVCPGLDGLCGAVTMDGWWESWDCDKRLQFICY